MTRGIPRAIDDLSFSVDDIARFNASFSKGGREECWPWILGTTKGGYGIFNAQSISTTAHRAAYVIFCGNAGTSLVCHTCDNPPCVNPRHLFVGTQVRNMQDCKAKGRMSPPPIGIGVRNGRAALRERDVILIRQSNIPSATLMKRFNVSRSAINSARTRRSWKHL